MTLINEFLEIGLCKLALSELDLVVFIGRFSNESVITNLFYCTKILTGKQCIQKYLPLYFEFEYKS